MVRLVIDRHPIDVPEGTTVLQAARQLGLDIPSLCYRDGCDPENSCMLCLVKRTDSGRLIPSCSTVVVDGMHVESETEEIREVRRTGLELLLSDHVGDCAAPCQNTCPAHMDIPRMLRQIGQGDLEGAIATVKHDIALPAVLGRICPDVCERACRRGVVDSPAAICRLKRYVADVDLATGRPYLPPCRPASGRRVAIVGTGPTGLAAAFHLLQEGHACTLLERCDRPGGALRVRFGAEELPPEVLDAEIGIILKLGATLQTGTTAGVDISLDALADSFDAVLLAVGAPAGDGSGGPGEGEDRKGLPALVRSATYETDRKGVFAAGSAVRPSPLVIKSVAEGKAAARCIDQYVRGVPITGTGPDLSVRIGRMDSPEVVQMMCGVSEIDRIESPQGPSETLTDDEARQEAQRCLHCDCGDQHGCLLRRYGRALGAEPNRFRSPRREFQRTMQHGDIVFEPGKCILCGLCVQIASKAAEPLGLTYVGRGFDVQIGVPFDRSLEDGLRHTARQCAEACPTGALVLSAECGYAGACGQCGRSGTECGDS